VKLQAAAAVILLVVAVVTMLLEGLVLVVPVFVLQQVVWHMV